MSILETERLDICHLTTEDAPFIRQLVNTPEWLQYIGDRNVYSTDDAVNYIMNGPMKSYERNGFGLSLVKLKSGGEPIGICGLIRRDSLDDVDIGFAYLPDYVGKGYAFEAADAMLKYGMDELKLTRIVAITIDENKRSIKLLEKLGMAFESVTVDPVSNEELMLFAIAR